jgi:hypothetical protein
MAVAIAKRVNPRKAVLSRCQCHELLRCEDFLAAIRLLKAMHELLQSLVMRWLMCLESAAQTFEVA